MLGWFPGFIASLIFGNILETKPWYPLVACVDLVMKWGPSHLWDPGWNIILIGNTTRIRALGWVLKDGLGRQCRDTAFSLNKAW